MINGLFLLTCIGLSTAAFTSLSSTDVTTAKSALTSLFRTNTDIHPTALRLSFHDCVGGCDGCINQDNASNAGLTEVISELDALYDGTYDSVMSRADFWNLAGIAAVELGVTINNRNCDEDSCTMPTPSFNFQWGRVDCGTTSTTTDTHEFPEPTMTGAESLAYFASEFGMDDQQTTAIMGAHTMGGAARANSGYRGAWISGQGRQFDNVFFQYISEGAVTFSNEDVAARTCDCNRWQWDGVDSNGDSVSFMLNTDLELWKTLTLTSEGQSTCDYHTECVDASATSAYVTTYASSTSDFMTDFQTAYEKITSNGATLQDVSR